MVGRQLCVVFCFLFLASCFFVAAGRVMTERNKSPWGICTCDLLFKGSGRNMLMVGCQRWIVSCFFVPVHATTMDITESEDNVLGVPDAVQVFLNTGLLGWFIATIVASNWLPRHSPWPSCPLLLPTSSLYLYGSNCYLHKNVC